MKQIKIQDIKLWPVQVEYLQMNQDMSDKERDTMILNWYNEGMVPSQ